LEPYEVVQKYNVCRPVYEQQLRTQALPVMKPVWQDYEVPVQWTTYRPVYEQHVSHAALHGHEADVAGISGTRVLATATSGLRATRSHRALHVQKPMWQEYQVP